MRQGVNPHQIQIAPASIGQQVDYRTDSLSHVKTVGSEQSKKGEQNPGNGVVLGAGGKSKVRLTIHARNQK